MKLIFTLLFILISFISYGQKRPEYEAVNAPLIRFNLEWDSHPKKRSSEIHRWRYGPWRKWKGVWTQRRVCVKHGERQSRTYCKS